MAEEKAKEVKTTEVKSTQPSEKHWTRPSNSTLTMIVLALVFFGLLCTAFTLGKRSSDRFDRADRFGSGTMMQGYSARSGATGGGMMESGGPRGGMMGDRTGSNENTTTSTRVMGVVTAVDGDTITVAGNGATTKVTVNDNTTYSGDDKPAKVNDTIMAFGARDSSDNLVASTVRLTRQ